MEGHWPHTLEIITLTKALGRSKGLELSPNVADRMHYIKDNDKWNQVKAKFLQPVYLWGMVTFDLESALADPQKVIIAHFGMKTLTNKFSITNLTQKMRMVE